MGIPMYNFKPLDFNINWHDRVSSTNDLCMSAATQNSAEGYVIAAKFQEHGRGQRGNTWESSFGLNLTFSLLLRPIFLRVEHQFAISKVVAVSICDWIGAHIKDKTVAIKWPNDIYIGNSKVAGILIENNFSSSQLEVSVIGIGINLNQQSFSSDLPNPTSLINETGNIFNLEESLLEYLSCFRERYEQVRSGNVTFIDTDYLNLLYRKDIYCTYRASNDEFRARIIGVKPTGELMLQTESGQERSFAFKEITFVI